MKLTFKVKTFVALGIGASLFFSTAFADMLLSSGYEKIKKSLKYTTEQLASGLDSFTMEGTYQISVDDQKLAYEYSKEKYDLKNLKQETYGINETYYESNTYEHYYYRDQNQSVWKDYDENKLYVTPFSDDHFEKYPYDKVHFENPFAEEGAVEFEKIVDAVVGNLQDVVIVESTNEGGYEYSGSLNEAQIPSIINAISSYLAKQHYNDMLRYSRSNTNQFPTLATDISIDSVTGQVIENDQGLVTNINANLSFSGNDEQGVSHTVEVNVELLLYDINSTVVELPDLTDAIVQTENYSIVNMLTQESSVGTYSNNIVIEKDGKIIKIGERQLNIEAISKDIIKGSMKEILYEGYENEYNPLQLTFRSIEFIDNIAIIHYVDNNGNENTAIARMPYLDTIEFEPDVFFRSYEDGGYSYSSTPLQHFNINFTKTIE